MRICVHKLQFAEHPKTSIFMVALPLLLVFMQAIIIAVSSSASDYSIKCTSIGELEAKRIQNDYTGEYVEVIVDYGGRVEDLVLRSHSTGQLRKVLLTHDGNATAIEENVWSQGMLLIPWANRIAYGRYNFFNTQYQLPINELSLNPLLINSLHGFMDGKKMDVTKYETGPGYGMVELSYSFDQPLYGYPFTFDVSIKYILTDSDFFMVFYVTNQMESDPLPFYMGWHPYFLCVPYESYVVLDPCTPWNHVELNANMNPTGQTHLYHGLNGSHPIGGNYTNPTFYDDEFKPTHPYNDDCLYLHTKLYDTATDQTVVLWQDSSFRFVHVFTGRGGAIAIEPMSGMADAYNNHDHLTVLSGGESWEGAVGVYVE